MSGAGGGTTVSVVIGAYNAAAWISHTLESVLAQTFPVLEVIVVDDGSTDRTPTIVRSYGGKVRYVAEKHRGLPQRNRGIELAHGDFVAFIDADDYWDPRKIELQTALLRTGDFCWAICDSRWLQDETGVLIEPSSMPARGGDILAPLFLSNFIVASTPIVERRVLGELGGFAETPIIPAGEDWDLWLRIAAHYPVALVPGRLATLRLHAESLMAATPLARRVASLETVISRAIAREPERLSPLKGRALANIYHAAGVELFRQGSYIESRPYFLKALRQRPIHTTSWAYAVLTQLGTRACRSALQLRNLVRGQP